MCKCITIAAAAAVALGWPGGAQAYAAIYTVTVGNTGNAADTRYDTPGYGAADIYMNETPQSYENLDTRSRVAKGEPGDICGDGLIEGPEDCDDGNADPGDGCSSTCHEEPGWDCVGEPSVCTPVCDPPCVHGTCEDLICFCETGWSGLACDTPECNPPCDHGACTSPGTCTCEADWSGDTCDSPICDPPCDHGTCSAFTCICEAAWLGDTCDMPVCYGLPADDPSVCSAHGACIAPDTCSCEIGWSGADCFYAVCNPPCVHGICTPGNTCSCYPPWTGITCEIIECPGLPDSSFDCDADGDVDLYDFAAWQKAFTGDLFDLVVFEDQFTGPQ